MVKYPEYATELEALLEVDQKIWKTFSKAYHSKEDESGYKVAYEKLRLGMQERTIRMLEILNAIHEPSLSNIGSKAAQAISILALHGSLTVLKKVLAAFEKCHERDKNDTYYQAIPSMVDRVLILERQPQIFGTQWEMDEHGQPFLPTVKDLQHVNDRRAQYGIENFRWPKSLAIPESEQPWLKKPLSELMMRDITDQEIKQKYQDYLQ